MVKSKNEKENVKSTNYRIGKRTYFFDVNVASNDVRYLKITESRFVEEGKDRIRNSFVLFPEDAKSFQKNLNDMLGYL